MLNRVPSAKNEQHFSGRQGNIVTTEATVSYLGKQNTRGRTVTSPTANAQARMQKSLDIGSANDRPAEKDALADFTAHLISTK